MSRFFKNTFNFKKSLLILLLFISSCKSTIETEPFRTHPPETYNTVEKDEAADDTEETRAENTEAFTEITDSANSIECESDSRNIISVSENGYASISLYVPLNERDVDELNGASTVELFVKSSADYSMLCKCNSIKNLMIYYSQYDNESEYADLTEIMKSGIEAITVNGNESRIILNGDLSFYGIKELNINNSVLAINGIVDFPDLKDLTFTDVDLNYSDCFLPFRNSERIYLRNCKFKDDNENCLSVCGNLQELSFIDCDIILINSFNKLPNLSYLFLYNESGDMGYTINSLREMSQIETIYYGFNLFSNEDVESLKEWYPNAEIISIGGI